MQTFRSESGPSALRLLAIRCWRHSEVFLLWLQPMWLCASVTLRAIRFLQLPSGGVNLVVAFRSCHLDGSPYRSSNLSLGLQFREAAVDLQMLVAEWGAPPVAAAAVASHFRLCHCFCQLLHISPLPLSRLSMQHCLRAPSPFLRARRRR